LLSAKNVPGSQIGLQYPLLTKVPTGHEFKQIPLYFNWLFGQIDPVIQIPLSKSNPELQAVQKEDDRHEKQFELHESHTLLTELGNVPASQVETHDPLKRK
jgi:hypothetical protein